MTDTAEKLYRRLLDQTVNEKPIDKPRRQVMTGVAVELPSEQDADAYKKLLEDFVHSSTLDTPKLRHNTTARRG